MQKPLPHLQDTYRWWLLLALAIILFMVNIDYTAVNLALSSMADTFTVEFGSISWVLTGYIFAWGLAVIPSGKYADLHAKRDLCLVGLLLFLISSLLAGFATSANLLIAARFLQGVAGAIYIPCVYGLIALHFSAETRGKAMGIITLAVGLGGALGPFVGGILVTYLNWRYLFLINLPLGALAAAIIYKSQYREILPAHHQGFLKSLIHLIPSDLFRNWAFIGCCLGMGIEQFGFSTIMVTSGLYLQKIMNFSPFKSSIEFLFITVVFGVIAATGGPWVDRAGIRLPTVTGLIIIAIGAFLFAQVDTHTSNLVFESIFLLFGTGMGFAFVGLNTGIMQVVSEDHVGIASSIFAAFALTGNFLGASITTLFFEMFGGISLSLIVCGTLCLIATLICYCTLNSERNLPCEVVVD